MPRKSTIDQLPAALREALDALIRDGRHTLDEILAHLAKLNDGEEPVSRSALGRYAQRAEAQMQRYREAQEVAKVWVQKFEADPQGDVARLLPEMLRSVAFQTLGSMSEREDAAAPEEVMLLAKAMKDLASADKLTADRIIKIRAEAEAAARKKLLAEQSKTLDAARGELGVSDETLALIHRKLGIK